MNLHRLKAGYERWRVESYPRLGPLIMLFCIFVSTSAAVGVFWLTKVQGDEQQRRADAIRGLQDCFDTYATRSAVTSKAVRDAAELVSDAQAGEARAAVTEALVDVEWTNALVSGLAFQGQEESPEAVAIVEGFLTTTRELQAAKEGQAEAEAKLVEAQENLTKVRAENPVPDPPSTFCDVQP